MKVEEQSQQRYYHFQTVRVFTHLVPPLQISVHLQEGASIPKPFWSPGMMLQKATNRDKSRNSFTPFFIQVSFTGRKYSVHMEQIQQNVKTVK